MPPIDYTTLPACTYEDGSEPGQVLPCRWDAAVQGNGQGKSFILTEAGGEPLYDATPVVTPEPVATPVAQSVLEQPAAAAALTAPAPAAPAELAHTGMDGVGLMVAVLMVTIGAVLAPIGKRARS